MPSSDRARPRRRLGLAVGIGLLGLGVVPTMAGDFDGSKLLICAPGGDCAKGLPEEIGAPSFMRIDVANKAVIGPKRTTTIQLMDKSETQLMLQGTELGYGWVIAVDQETGRMTATLADREGAFVLFGACTVP